MTPKVKITWEEPPPANYGKAGHSRGSKWDAIAEQIKKNPGVWALVGKQLPNSVGTWFRENGFLTTTRNNVRITPTTIRCDVYVMWPKGK